MWACGCKLIIHIPLKFHDFLSGIMAELATGQALFGIYYYLFFVIFFSKKYIFLAGESDIDQLYRIQKCLGPLPINYLETMKNNPKFEGLKVLLKSSFLNMKKKPNQEFFF